MNICIETTMVRKPHFSGIEKYIIRLVEGIVSKINHDDQLFLITTKYGETYFDKILSGCNNPNITIVSSPFTSTILTEQLWLPWIMFKKFSEFDVVHYTTLGPSLALKSKNSLLTLHDVVPWVETKTLSLGMKMYYKPLLHLFVKCKRNLSLITVSEFSKKEIERVLNFKNEIYVTKLAGDSNVKKVNTQKYNEKYSFEYCLAVGTIEPRKNLNLLLEVFSTDSNPFDKLVIVGKKGWGEDLRKEYNLSNVIFTGYVSEEELDYIYKNAKVFLQPSVYEGFGLPNLEAQMYGIPVLASDISVFNEILGESAVYFNPFDSRSLLNQLDRIKNSVTLYESMQNKSIENSKKYSWDITVDNTLEIYRRYQ